MVIVHEQHIIQNISVSDDNDLVNEKYKIKKQYNDHEKNVRYVGWIEIVLHKWIYTTTIRKGQT